jgi:hypothetical protein
MDDYAVCYRLGDMDQQLLVKKVSHVTKGDRVVFDGGHKSCRQYVATHDRAASFKSARRSRPYEL